MNKFDRVNELVIAVDDKSSWRKAYFPRYKESRKKTRDKSDVDFPLLYAQIEEYQKVIENGVKKKHVVELISYLYLSEMDSSIIIYENNKVL